MSFDEAFNIIQSKPKSFHIVKVAGMYPVKLTENIFLVFCAYAYSFIINGYHNMVVPVKSSYGNFGRRWRLFVCIVEQVGYLVFDVLDVGLNYIIAGIELHLNCTISFFHD